MKDTYDFSDTGNANLLCDLYGNNLRYDHKTERWLQWRDQHRWYELNPSQIQKLAIQAINHRFELAKMSTDKADASKQAGFAVRSRNLNNLTAMLKLASNMEPIGNYTIQWDNQPNLLAVGNGVVNLATGSIRPGQRNDFITRGIGLPYLPDAKAPLWERFLSDITLHRQDLIDFLHRAFGYTLTGFTREQVFFLLHGHGANGKDTFTNIIKAVIPEFSKDIRFTAFDENNTGDARRDIAELPGMRAAFASEGGKKVSLETSSIKYITGGATIATSRKYGHPFEFKPQFKLWLATNVLPQVDDTSHGFWRRIILIPFDATFDGADRDKDMESKLIAELPGILAWAIRGAHVWSREGLGTPDWMLLKVNEYRSSEDIVGNFIDECCIEGPEETTQAAFLYETFRTWCEEKGMRALTNTDFGRRMAHKYPRGRNVHGAFYVGIGIRMKV